MHVVEVESCFGLEDCLALDCTQNTSRYREVPLQMVQNMLLRTLNGTKVKDMISTASLLDKFGILSVNQFNAQIKLLEIWKSLNVEKYPLTIKVQNTE